jgi:alkylation response protein AidB-like acyl-CoA dehydrogenase
MEFRFSADDERFRQEVRGFIRRTLPADWEGGDWESDQQQPEVSQSFARGLAERRWHVMAWPAEYGGLGAGYMQQLVYNEEMSYAQAPSGGTWAGVQLVGPTVMLYGTEEQKRRVLPSIAAAEVTWCQGFSEPNAGSDLASLQTRAVREGDEFVVNGQKIWTSSAQHADWCILLARTDPEAPKHKGISYFLVDMKSPGVTVRPLTDLSGGQPFNEMFFENVRVPAENLLGELNRGWYMAATTLDFERSGIGTIASCRREWERAATAYQESRPAKNGRATRDPVRSELVERRIEIEAGRALAYRVVAMQARGMVPNHEASASKLFGSELNQRLANTQVRLLGLYGALMPDSHRERMKGRAAHRYLFSVQDTIAAGTSEIQRNIIATRGLVLPRG